MQDCILNRGWNNDSQDRGENHEVSHSYVILPNNGPTEHLELNPRILINISPNPRDRVP
jgi:hypothetical protein